MPGCHIWFDCKSFLRKKMGKEVKIFITIRISEDTTAETVIKMVLHSVQIRGGKSQKKLRRLGQIARRLQIAYI